MMLRKQTSLFKKICAILIAVFASFVIVGISDLFAFEEKCYADNREAVDIKWDTIGQTNYDIAGFQDKNIYTWAEKAGSWSQDARFLQGVVIDQGSWPVVRDLMTTSSWSVGNWVNNGTLRDVFQKPWNHTFDDGHGGKLVRSKCSHCHQDGIYKSKYIYNEDGTITERSIADIEADENGTSIPVKYWPGQTFAWGLGLLYDIASYQSMKSELNNEKYKEVFGDYKTQFVANPTKMLCEIMDKKTDKYVMNLTTVEDSINRTAEAQYMNDFIRLSSTYANVFRCAKDYLQSSNPENQDFANLDDNYRSYVRDNILMGLNTGGTDISFVPNWDIDRAIDEYYIKLTKTYYLPDGRVCKGMYELVKAILQDTFHWENNAVNAYYNIVNNIIEPYWTALYLLAQASYEDRIVNICDQCQGKSIKTSYGEFEIPSSVLCRIDAKYSRLQEYDDEISALSKASAMDGNLITSDDRHFWFRGADIHISYNITNNNNFVKWDQIVPETNWKSSENGSHYLGAIYTDEKHENVDKSKIWNCAISEQGMKDARDIIYGEDDKGNRRLLSIEDINTMISVTHGKFTIENLISEGLQLNEGLCDTFEKMITKYIASNPGIAMPNYNYKPQILLSSYGKDSDGNLGFFCNNSDFLELANSKGQTEDGAEWKPFIHIATANLERSETIRTYLSTNAPNSYNNELRTLANHYAHLDYKKDFSDPIWKSHYKADDSTYARNNRPLSSLYNLIRVYKYIPNE